MWENICISLKIKFESKLYGSKSAVKIEEKYILSKTPVNVNRMKNCDNFLG